MAVGESPAFGVLLSRYRLAAGLTQEELAAQAGLSSRAISDLERGVRRHPQPHTVRQLAEALRLGPHDRALFERMAVAPEPPSRDALAAVRPRPTGGFLGALPGGALVARDEEVVRICAILDAVAGGTGQLLLLAGELGAGKTRLAQEVLALAQAQGFLGGTGRCYLGAQQTPLRPVLEALDDLAAGAPVAVRAEAQRCRQELQRAMRERASSDGGSWNLFDEPYLGPLITHLLNTLAEHMPVVVLIDDLHWADDGSVRVLSDLARTTRGSRVLLAGTFRDVRLSEEHPTLSQALQDLGRERLLERISVRRLAPEETAALVAVLMGQAQVSDEVADFIHRRSKGNPRVVDQLVRALGGRLHLRREVGAGAMGRIFEAVDSKTGATVAAKVLLSRGEADFDGLLRFQQEGALLAALCHPHIVRIYDTFVEEHASCIIMEFLDAPSLGEILRHGPLPLPRAKHVALQVAAALSYAHAQLIVHRDIKPDNVMVLAGDRVKVTDFGIARLQPDTSVQTIATTGMRLGTPLYMAPEQITGTKADGRTDIYAFGALLFHMVTGRPPFEGSDALAVAVKHLHEKPSRPSLLNAALPADWDALILKALQKDPARRFQSARDMERAISALGEKPPSAVHASRRPPWAAAATAGLLLALVASVVAVRMAPSLTVRPASLGTHLHTYLAGLAAKGQFSGTVLVARHGSIVLEQGYGLADRARHRPNTPTTLYPVPGVSDSFSILGVLQLIQQGKVAWQTPICRYLARCPPSWQPITVRRVLEGTAGLPEYGWGKAGYTTQRSIAGCQALPQGGLFGLPGSTISYWSCAILVLGTIIEQMPPRNAWEISLLNGNPHAYGVDNTWRVTDALATSALARSYDGPALDPSVVYNDFFQAYATVHDIYAYDNALFGGKLLSHPFMTRLFAPRPSLSLTDWGIDTPRIGYLWRTGTAFGHRVIYTDATVNSFATLNMRFADAGLTIVVISNNMRGDVEDIGIHLAAQVFGQRPPPRPATMTTAPAALLGTYRRTLQNADRTAAHDPNIPDWVGSTLWMTIKSGWIEFAPPGTTPGTTPGTQEYVTASTDGRLTLKGWRQPNESSFCSNNPHQDPPPGYYRWARRGNSLLITRREFDPCLDRGALMAGQWTKMR